MAEESANKGWFSHENLSDEAKADYAGLGAEARMILDGLETAALAEVLEAFDRERTGESAPPGKFEGEPPWVAYLYTVGASVAEDCHVDGDGSFVDSEEAERLIRVEACEANGIDDPDSEEADELMEMFGHELETEAAIAAQAFPIENADFELFPSLVEACDKGRPAQVALRVSTQGFVEFVGASAAADAETPAPSQAGPSPSP